MTEIPSQRSKPGPFKEALIRRECESISQPIDRILRLLPIMNFIKRYHNAKGIVSVPM